MNKIVIVLGLIYVGCGTRDQPCDLYSSCDDNEICVIHDNRNAYCKLFCKFDGDCQDDEFCVATYLTDGRPGYMVCTTK